jgi:DNA N-6-adenine-methyltransferase Dam
VSSGTGSEQVVGTPRDFLDAVEARFGKMDADLAATAGNAVGRNWYGPDSVRCPTGDSLDADWTEVDGNLWLNPPYKNIGPWAKKCAETPTGPDRRIFLLVPLTTSVWACRFIWGEASVLGLTPRLKFVGHTSSFPKDLCLAVYGELPGFDTWRWKR